MPFITIFQEQGLFNQKNYLEYQNMGTLGVGMMPVILI